ncbi:hypothetical protein AVEN_31380-1, partial [Araneus ventricosus]
YPQTDNVQCGCAPSCWEMKSLALTVEITESLAYPNVHSSCSTPNSQSPRTSLRILSSPSSSFPCSQDNRPDVIWDYTSPKLPKGYAFYF